MEKLSRRRVIKPRKLNKILDSDPGARYIGEFSLGFNPYVLQPMRDILFDEKIAGSFHFTPGQAYEEADNGNRSQVHWDMVSIQRPDYGGGEIYFDGKLIRRDGEFLLTASAIAEPYFSLGLPGGTRRGESADAQKRVRRVSVAPAGCLTSRRTGRIELHQSDVAITAALDARNLKHRCAFDRARSGAGQLNRYVLRTRVEDDRGDFKRW